MAIHIELLRSSGLHIVIDLETLLVILD